MLSRGLDFGHLPYTTKPIPLPSSPTSCITSSVNQVQVKKTGQTLASVSIMASQDQIEFIYKILPSAPATPLPSEFPLSNLDRNDGFIHLSMATQVNSFLKLQLPID